MSTPGTSQRLNSQGGRWEIKPEVINTEVLMNTLGIIDGMYIVWAVTIVVAAASAYYIGKSRNSSNKE